MIKKRVGIIFGGRSPEHDISIQSAKNIIKFIDKKQFDILLLSIDKKGTWYTYSSHNDFLKNNSTSHVEQSNKIRKIALLLDLDKKYSQLIYTDNLNSLPQIDVVFPITHGTLGEDGSLQGLLRIADIPYVGSDVLGSAISMDKDISKRLLRDAGLLVTPFITLFRTNQKINSFEEVTSILGLPLFIKPANQGSSIGVSKVVDKLSFEQALKISFSFDAKVLVEKAVVGREIECAVMGNDNIESSVCGEIVLNSGFYSYDNKYINKNNAQIIIPANISSDISNKIRNFAIKAFHVLNCSGMARVDFFLTADEKVLVNEVNTLPGFTSSSMYPRLWKASGLCYTNLISKLIELALARFRKN